ncbi:MAG: hypothetical protein ACR2M4_06390 [Actinomycetota bacterium]
MAIGALGDSLKVAKDLIAIGIKTNLAMSALTVHHGQLLLTQIQANASGRPGPNAPTGDYRRSWRLEVTRERGTTTAIASTNRVQGWRLERGFVGTDSLGRTYHQPPYAHVGPAIDKVGAQFVQAAERLVKVS